jgi:hypothetical protein
MEVRSMDSSDGMAVTRNEITNSTRVEISLGDQARPLAYRVTRQLDSDRYVIRGEDPSCAGDAWCRAVLLT